MTRAAAELVVCSRGHRLVRYEVTVCDAGHEHRMYVCPMRMGARAHGEQAVRPPFGSNCWDDEPG